MGSGIEQHQKQDKNMKLAAMLWWQILWYASDKGRKKIPSEQEWLSSELVAAMVKATTGKQWWVSSRHDESGTVVLFVHGWWSQFGQVLDDYVLPKKFGRWTRVFRLLTEFVRCDRSGDSHLKLFHENNALHNPGCSTFIPHQETFRISEQYIKNASGLNGWDQIVYGKACKMLGEHMQPYIERDLAYIKKNYLW